jgi:ABC-type nickel/cobalt efflux system permease component RcnA
MAALGAVCLTTVMLVMWFAFTADVRASFKVVEVATLVLFLLSALVMLYAIGRTQVEYDDERIRIRNGFRQHELAWTQVDEMRLDPGMAWVTMRTREGRRVFVMAVQSSDGSRAMAQLRQMRARAIEAGGLAGGQGAGTAR